MKIKLIAFSMIIPILPTSHAFAEEISTIQQTEKRHSLVAFKQFFSDHENPSQDLIRKTFGKPVLYTLFTGDSIAKQKGQFKLTADRACWCYELSSEDNSFVSIQVLNNKIYDVYATSRKSEPPRIIIRRSKGLVDAVKRLNKTQKM